MRYLSWGQYTSFRAMSLSRLSYVYHYVTYVRRSVLLFYALFYCYVLNTFWLLLISDQNCPVFTLDGFLYIYCTQAQIPSAADTLLIKHIQAQHTQNGSSIKCGVACFVLNAGTESVRAINECGSNYSRGYILFSPESHTWSILPGAAVYRVWWEREHRLYVKEFYNK